MDLPVQRLYRPARLDEALAILAAEPFARPVAGGTDLVVQLRDRRRRADVLVDLGRLGLSGIDLTDGDLSIGACTSMEAIARHPLVKARHPALAEAAGLVGAWPIQCRATLGGNLGNASPAADTVPALLVADAAVEIASRAGRRRLAVDQLFLAPGRTALGPDELIVVVHLPEPAEGRAVERFVKVGPRREQVISMVSLAGRAVVAGDGALTGVRVALGAVAPTPLRAHRVEASLEGQQPDAGRRHRAVALLQEDIRPIDDVRASAGYRRIAAAVLLHRFLEACHG